jgi:hypothetical protein
MLLVLLALHCGIGLMLRSRSVKDWKSTDGLLDQFDAFPIFQYSRTGTSQTGVGIEAEYSYSYGQAEFKGKYVSVLDFPPRLWTTPYGQLAPGLKDAYEHKRPVKVLLDPEKPHHAVLSVQPVSSGMKKSALALLIGGFAIWFSYIQMITGVDWIYGAALGLVVYGLFAMGWLSTAF